MVKKEQRTNYISRIKGLERRESGSNTHTHTLMRIGRYEVATGNQANSAKSILSKVVKIHNNQITKEHQPQSLRKHTQKRKMRLCDQRASTRRPKEPSEDYVLNCQHNARGTLVQLLEWATDLHKCRTLTLTLAVHFVATYKEWFLAPLDSFSFLFLSFF